MCEQSGSREDSELLLVERVVLEYRATNEHWVKAGAITVSCGDLPGGRYWGPDKELFQLCLEINALSRKMDELRINTLKTRKELDATTATDSVRLENWHASLNDYFGFCNRAQPFYESRLKGLFTSTPQTVHGLAKKLNVIKNEYLGASVESVPSDLVHSILRDIDTLIGVEQ